MLNQPAPPKIKFVSLSMEGKKELQSPLNPEHNQYFIQLYNEFPLNILGELHISLIQNIQEHLYIRSNEENIQKERKVVRQEGKRYQKNGKSKNKKNIKGG